MTEPELKRPAASKRNNWISIFGYFISGLLFLAALLSWIDDSSAVYFTYTLIALGLLILIFAVSYRLVLNRQIARELKSAKRDLHERLHEKDTLLKEVHHRVKNNLQTVCSLLNMQSRGTDDEQMKNLIKSSQNRVMAMAMVHEMLYLRDDLTAIDYKPYVLKLTEYLVKSVKGPDSKVKLAIDIPDIELGIDTAIPLGLLINETITNSLKYGIQDDAEGEIHIELKREDKDDYVLTIGDNGVGIAESVDPKTTKSLGLKLIHNLARQLKGSITRDWSRKGTNYIVKFKDIDHDPFHSIA